MPLKDARGRTAMFKYMPLWTWTFPAFSTPIRLYRTESQKRSPDSGPMLSSRPHALWRLITSMNAIKGNTRYRRVHFWPNRLFLTPPRHPSIRLGATTFIRMRSSMPTDSCYSWRARSTTTLPHRMGAAREVLTAWMSSLRREGVGEQSEVMKCLCLNWLV
jgi:hypothetical protein